VPKPIAKPPNKNSERGGKSRDWWNAYYQALAKGPDALSRDLSTERHPLTSICAVNLCFWNRSVVGISWQKALFVHLISRGSKQCSLRFLLHAVQRHCVLESNCHITLT
jgi:hypothetical protein